jgi:hypothetical protein
VAKQTDRSSDGAVIEVDDTAGVVTMSLEEYERLSSLETQLADVQANPEPAFEEGPHLKKAEIREAKRQQLLDAGVDADDNRLTEDMRDILAEG